MKKIISGDTFPWVLCDTDAADLILKESNKSLYRGTTNGCFFIVESSSSQTMSNSSDNMKLITEDIAKNMMECLNLEEKIKAYEKCEIKIRDA